MIIGEEQEVLEQLGRLLYPVLLGTPGLLVIIAGLGFSIYKCRQYQRTALLAITALSINLVSHSISMIYPIVVNRMIAEGIATEAIISINATLSSVSYLVGAVTLALLLAAVWSGRKARDNGQNRTAEALYNPKS